MKKNVQMFLGVIIGIVGILLLTLNIWGREWYKVILSTFGGVLAGLLVVDYRVTLSFILQGFKLPKKKISVKVKKPSNIFWIRLVISLLCVAGGFFSPPAYDDVFKDLFFKLVLLCLFVFLNVFLFLTLWSISCPRGLTTYFWGSDFSKELHKPMDIFYDFGILKEKINNDKTFFALFKAIICSVVSWLVFLFFILCGGLSVLYFILSWLFSITLGIVTLPLYIFKMMGSCSWSLLVSTSIVIGGLVGTISESYNLGIYTGVGFLALSLLLDKLLKDSLVFVRFFFVYRKGLVEKLNCITPF